MVDEEFRWAILEVDDVLWSELPLLGLLLQPLLVVANEQTPAFVLRAEIAIRVEDAFGQSLILNQDNAPLMHSMCVADKGKQSSWKWEYITILSDKKERSNKIAR